MFQLDRSYLVLLGILSVLSFFSLDLPSSFSVDVAVDQRFTAIPLKMGNWIGMDIPLDQRTYEILETKNVLSRLYENAKGEKIHLLLVSSNKDRRVAHPPEVCYSSSHYTITASKESAFELSGNWIPVREFVAEDQRNPAHKEQVLYVYRVGKQFTTNYYAQQLQFAWDRLARKESEVLLIRISGTSEQPFREFLTHILQQV